ncbi:MAG: dihydroorotase [Archangium sp.]|nr:dihydroorotase [Archangium sp.]
MRLVFRGGRLLDPAARRDGLGEVLIVAGEIAAVGPKVDAAGAKVIELDGAWVTPGFVDLHSVLRDERDLEAALRGGFTTVVAAPESARLRSDRLQVLTAAPLTRKLEGEELGETPSDAACLSQGFRPLVKSGVLRRALQYSASRGKLLVLHAEDPSLTGAGVLGEGLTATRLGLPAVPVAAEAAVIARDLLILEETGGRLHFAHVTTARGVDLIRAAKQRGLQVSCDVTPHHLTRDDRAAEGYALEARVWPPLRSPADVKALALGLGDGTIDAVACDHVRVDILDREHPFEACAPGCEAFEQALPAVLGLDLPALRAVEVLSSAPARLLGLTTGLVPGLRAALTVIDAKARAVRHTFSSGVLS